MRSFPRIWSHLLNKSFMENFIFCLLLVKKTGFFKISYISPIFKKLLKCLVLRFYFSSNLFIYPWWIFDNNCNDFASYKVWKKYWMVCHSVYLPVFQHLHWKKIYSNHLCLKSFKSSLYFHFLITTKSLV